MADCPQCGKPIPEGQDECPYCAEEKMDLSTSVTAHINLLKKKIEKEPLNAQLHIDLAEIYQQYGYLQQALAEYEKAVNADIRNYAAQTRSAHLYLKFKKVGQAENAFRAALQINPGSLEALIGLFRTLYLQNRTDEAIVLCEKIVTSKPDNVEFHILLKNLYNSKGDKEKALKELLILESLSPDSEQFVKEIALYYQKAGDMDKAHEYYKKMSDRRIKDIVLGIQIGEHYYDNKQYDTARKQFAQLIESSDLTIAQEALIRTYIASIEFIDNEVAKAKSTINEIQQSSAQSMAMDHQKKLAALCFKIAQQELQHKKRKKAKPFLNRAVILDRENSEYRDLLTKVESETAVMNKKTTQKITVIIAGIAVVAVIFGLMWIMTHNRIIIDIDPAEGALISVDGRSIDTKVNESGTISSPQYFMGSHDVSIEQRGYEKWQGTVDIGFAKSTHLELTLVPIYFSMKISSIPKKANVFIDGKNAGRTPYSTDSIVTRPHIIELSYPGHSDWRTELIVNDQDSVDIGVIKLKNLAGKWYGKIGENTFAYNADFNMTIQQTDTFITIKFYHRPRDVNYYSGNINGKVKNHEFHAQGNVAYKYKDVFYWAQTKKKITINGTISENWNRLEGRYRIESLAEQKWWATR
jgi:tetratricopeptide (TPR) repeat protein